MFSLHPYDELVFANPTTPQEYKIPDDLIVDPSLFESNLISFSATQSNEKQPSQATNSRSSRRRQTDQSKYGSNDKRVMHRDIERRRRQQMSKLYVSLSSLLPNKKNLDELIRERSSSVCDQMEEAANYIKQMHKNIEELQTRRDDLKKLNSSSSQGRNVENSDGSDNCVAIHEVMDGLEILFSSESPEFEPSRVLSELVERDLDVVSCVSTRSKGGYLHKFEIKAWNMMNLDVSELHDKLADAIKF